MAEPMKILEQVTYHYRSWKEDGDKRRTRKNGWNDVTDAYWGKLPADWPYTSKVVDPRIRTSLTEKNARLLNAKLRGRLVPREGGDALKARINNSLLDFQWDTANDGGSMLSKWAAMDMDSRLYGSKFALVLWKHTEDKDGKVTFDGNEFFPLDIRDCGIDPTANHIRNAKWFQVRDWVKIEDLEQSSDTPDKQKYTGLRELKARMEEGASQNRKDSEYQSRVLQNKGLQDRTGEDKSFPVVERVREFRKDRWICFFPKYNVLGYDHKNPYEHGQIPVVQLRYYPLGDDPIGESEVEPVIPLWKAICATMCGYLDNMNIHMRPPLKVKESGVRMETIIWAAEAPWIMDDINNVQEMQSNGEAMRYFQTTYSALVSAFNTAMGDLSQGAGGVDPLNPGNKTATEIKQTTRQQNVRDQANQMYLGEAIADMMMMWLINNKQFLFLDPDKQEFILQILGTDLFDYYKRSGLDGMEVKPEALQMIGDIVQGQGGNVSDGDLQTMMDAAKTPRFPIFKNPKEKNPEKLEYKAKMRLNDMGDGGELSLVPEDLDGTYDYIPSTVSMQAGANETLIVAQQNAINDMRDPVTLQLLQAQGVRPLIKELLIDKFNGSGLPDAEKYFESMESQPQLGSQGASSEQMQPQSTVIPVQVAGSANVPNIGGGMTSPNGQGNNMIQVPPVG